MKGILRQVHPFLNNKFRTVYQDELKSKEVFNELFSSEPTALWKLEAIWKYQDKPTRKVEPKPKPNAKVQK